MSKIVPDEPTQEMLQAGIKAFQHAYSSGDPLTDWHAFYKAAIAAAPAPVDGLVYDLPARLRGEVSEGRAGFDALPSSSSLPGFDQYKIAMSDLLDLMDEAAAALQSRDEGCTLPSRHEWFEGKCVHCEILAKDYRPTQPGKP